MKEELIARVPSLSDPKVLYDITLRRSRFGTASDEMLCSCQAFYSWKKRGEKCWHLRVYESAARALDRCWNEHGTQDGFVCTACLLALLSKMASVVKQDYVDKATVEEKVKKARAKRKLPTYRCRYCGEEFKKPSARTSHEMVAHHAEKRA